MWIHCWFRVNQHWISAVQRWKPNVSEFKKSALSSGWFRSDPLWNNADQRWCFSCSLNQWWNTSNLWNSAVQRCLSLGLHFGSSYVWLFVERAQRAPYFPEEKQSTKNWKLIFKAVTILDENFVKFCKLQIFGSFEWEGFHAAAVHTRYVSIFHAGCLNSVHFSESM